MARTSVMTQGSNLFQTTAEDLNRIATDFISDGIVGAVANTSGVAPMTGGLAVNAQGTPDRTVAITAGYAYVTATPTSQASQRLRVAIDAQNLTHATNTTGSTRYDWIYVQVSASLAANPAVAGDTTGTVVISRSTSSSVDNGTPPTYGYHIATVTLTNSYTTIVNGNIADTRVQAGATATPTTVITGMPVQVASVAYGAVATGTTLIPSDDTIPQSSEGDQYMTLSITPKSATNILVIEAIAHCSHSVSTSITVALFQDSTANGLAATSTFMSTGTGRVVLPLGHTMAAGTTASTAFKVRIGGANAGTTTFNGTSGGRVYGGITGSFLKITEYKA